MPSVKNYGRTWTFRPSTIAYPENAAQLQTVVAGARKVRVMGSRHSWSKGIVTDGTLVSLDRMNRLVRVDKDNLRVTVQAGIKLRDLIARLEEHGLALANLGSIDHQSLAGAICTGTHGTGKAFRCLADQVESLELIDGAAAPRRVARGNPDFDAVVVGLGCFGIIHEITLSVVPCFQIRAVTGTTRFDELVDHLDDYVAGNDHFKLWWLVPCDTVILFQNKRTDAARNDSALKRWFKDEFLSVAMYRALVALESLDRKRLVPAINEMLTRETGRPYDRICKGPVGFLVPSPPVHRETEWAFDYRDARDLLKKYRDLLSSSGHTYNFIQEIRFTRGDDFWLSPAYERDSIWLSMYNMDRADRWDDQLARFEAFAMARGGRPHWGKEASFDPSYLQKVWPRLEELRQLTRAYDPEAKFVNAWVEGIFGG
jgi:FAD/FMN-containing dehydrogenase